MTSPAPVPLDTDTLSAVLRRNPTVVQPAREYPGDRRGESICDADVLIAATAPAEGCDLAPNNGRRFGRIAAGLNIDNWLEQA